MSRLDGAGKNGGGKNGDRGTEVALGDVGRKMRAGFVGLTGAITTLTKRIHSLTTRIDADPRRLVRVDDRPRAFGARKR